MSVYLDYAVELRKDLDVHHNCAETVVLAFKDVTGISEDIITRITSNFGKGMKMGSTCGCLTGCFMVLGLLGIDDQQTISQFVLDFKRTHDGAVICGELLRQSHALGIERKAHCDKLVFETVEYLEKFLRERGLI